MTDTTDPTEGTFKIAEPFLGGPSSIRSGMALHPVAKKFTDLKHGDIVLTPQGVLERVVGEPREEGGSWVVGISATASMGPLRTFTGEAMLLTFEPASFVNSLNI